MVIVKLGQGLKHNISVEKASRSKLFTSLLSTYNTDTIPISDSVCDQVLDNYVTYDIVNSCFTMDSQLLSLCLDFCHLIDDDHYFNYLIGLLHGNWNEYNVIINNLNYNLQYNIYLNSPLQWTPNDIKQSPCYIQRWIKTSSSKLFNIGNDVYTSKITYYDDGIVQSLECLVNGILHGDCINWYQTGSRDIQKYYYNDNICGDVIKYYPNGNKMYHWTYKDDDLHGVCQGWSTDGKFLYSQEFLDGKIHGPSTHYVDDGNYIKIYHTSTNSYVLP